MMRFPSSRNSFLDHFGGPKEVKIDQTSSSDDVKNEKSENVDFVDPSIKNHSFWVPMEAKMEAKWGLKSIFIAIENDDGKVMQYREGSGS